MLMISLSLFHGSESLDISHMNVAYFSRSTLADCRFWFNKHLLRSYSVPDNLTYTSLIPLAARRWLIFVQGHRAGEWEGRVKPRSPGSSQSTSPSIPLPWVRKQFLQFLLPRSPPPLFSLSLDMPNGDLKRNQVHGAETADSMCGRSLAE